MAAPICDDEDYFSRPNKYKFNDIIGIISAKNGIGIKAFQKQCLRPGYWVDTRRFLSKTKHELANGLFEVFGDFSNESASAVRETLIGWIYDNFRDVGMWTKLMLTEKNLTLSAWTENMQKETTPRDDLCLYLLARMYNKHVYVHTKLFYWCTAIHKIQHEIDLELINDCSIELVFVHTWVFGEVKRVHIPKGLPPAKPTDLDTQDVGITGNDNTQHQFATKECSVVLRPIRQPQDANEELSSQPGKLSARRTSRKRPVTDYRKLADYNEDDEHSPPVKRKKSANLLRRPSRYRQRIEKNRRTNKKKSKSSETSDSKSIASGNVGTSPPTAHSDSMSPSAEQLVVPTNAPTPPTDNMEDNIESVPTSNRKTILAPATEEETAIAIDALLSLGQDLNFGTETDPDENDLLQLIAPGANLPDPAPMVSEINSDDTEILDYQPTSENEQKQTEDKPNPEQPKPVQKKGTIGRPKLQIGS